MSSRAWVTLATNDSYGLGALVLAHSLRRVGSAYPAVILITPAVTEAMRERLRAVFAEVVTVDVLDSRDAAHLALLQRPELGITFTKIHCWNLTQYEKCVFLDADTLVVQNCDELFEREQLSAAPDVGWPDCFNSGVFVFSPSADTFSRLITFAQQRGSFDGGDQGLLNSFFSDWAHGDINKHLPFLYNVTSAAFYSYLPALKHFGQNLKIIHFIGAAKPWLQHYNFESGTVDAPEHLRGFLQLWWDMFASQVHPRLDTSMSGVAGNLARVLPGAAGQREAIDELNRRQGWEAGNIDYMGADSFENIWAKISQTLNKSRSSPPKQSPPKEVAPPPAPKPSPPKEVAPEQVEVQSGVVVQEPVAEQVEIAKEAVPVETATPVVPVTPVAAPAEVSPLATPVAPKVPVPVADPVRAEVPVPVNIPPTVEVAASVETIPVSVPKSPVDTPVVVKADAPTATATVASPGVVEKPEVPVPVEQAPAPADVPLPVETAAAKISVEAPISPPAKVATPAPAVPAPVAVIAQPEKKTETPVAIEKVAPAPVAEKAAKPQIAPVKAPVKAPKAVKPSEADSVPAAAAKTPKASAPKPQGTSVPSATDSPPLANTPSKEEAPAVPEAKTTEEAAQETRL